MSNQTYNFFKKKIKSGLSRYVKKDSIVNCEFDLAKFNQIAKISKNKNQFIKFFLDIFLELIGKKGTLIIPGFSYSWGKNKKKKIFHPEKTRPEVGILPDYLLSKGKAVRTKDPMFSFFILGNNKNYFKDIGNNSFGKKSMYEKIFKNNGLLVSFGLNQFDPTFVHFVEQYYSENIKKLHYRYLKKFTGILIEKKRKNKKSFYTFSRKSNYHFSFNGKKIEKKLKKSGKLKKLNLLKNDIYIVKSKDFFNAGVEGLKKDKNYFIKLIK